MNINHLFILPLFLMQVFCAPVQYTDQKQEIPIQQMEGFIDKDTYQTLCSVSIDKYEEKKDQLVDACRIKTVQEWATYKLEFNNYQIGDEEILSFKNFQKKSKKGAVKKNRWKSNQTTALLKTYADLFPGRIVYEATTKDKWTGTYRVSRKNLLNTIVRRSIEFIPEINDKKESYKTIFK